MHARRARDLACCRRRRARHGIFNRANSAFSRSRSARSPRPCAWAIVTSFSSGARAALEIFSQSNVTTSLAWPAPEAARILEFAHQNARHLSSGSVGAAVQNTQRSPKDIRREPASGQLPARRRHGREFQGWRIRLGEHRRVCARESIERNADFDDLVGENRAANSAAFFAPAAPMANVATGMRRIWAMDSRSPGH